MTKGSASWPDTNRTASHLALLAHIKLHQPSSCLNSSWQVEPLLVGHQGLQKAVRNPPEAKGISTTRGCAADSHQTHERVQPVCGRHQNACRQESCEAACSLIYIVDDPCSINHGLCCIKVGALCRLQGPAPGKVARLIWIKTCFLSLQFSASSKLGSLSVLP